LLQLASSALPTLNWDESLLRLALAAVLGGMIGVERELRERRGRFERQVRPLTRDARAESNLLSSQAEYITAQFENLVQSSRTAGTELAEKLQKRVASLV